MSLKLLRAAGKTHIGKVREQNEDAFFISPTGPAPLPNLFLVADGMGGHNAGDFASSSAIGVFCDFFDTFDNVVPLENCLFEALTKANENVYFSSQINSNYKGMGTTLTAATITANSLHFAHVGDSRIYLIKNNDTISQITKDHISFTADMVAQGVITKDEAKKLPKRVLTQAVGTDVLVEIDKNAVLLENTSHVLLCTDGLTDMLGDSEILEIIKSNTKIDEIAEKLTEAALDAGGRDNISVIVIGWD